MVIAIMALTLLTAGAIAISSTARLEVRASLRGLDQVRRDAALRGAVSRGVALLEEVRNDPAGMRELLDRQRELPWSPLVPATETDAPSETLYAFQIVDASARLSMNTVTSDQLRKLGDLDQETAQAILDWREEDEGDDDGDYAGEPRPYTPRDRPFDTLEELLLIRGMDPQQLFGEPTVQRTRSLRVPPLSELLAPFSGETNTDASGNPRANLNSASARELADAANNLAATQRETGRRRDNQERQVVDPAQAEALVQQRETNRQPFRTVFEALQQSGIEDRSWGIVLDAWTVDGRSFLPHRVNVNSAPAAVLSLIPGISAKHVEQILRQRRERPEGITWTELLQIVGAGRQNQEVPPSLPPEGGQPGQQNPQQSQQQQQEQQQQQALGQLESLLCFRSAAYYVRCLVRESNSTRIDAACALVYLPAATDESGSIVQWRRPAKFPGWSAWYRLPEENEGMTRAR